MAERAAGTRKTDDSVHPKAVERQKTQELRYIQMEREARDNARARSTGLGLMSFGALVVAVPIVTTSTIELIPALVGLAIIIAGGLLNNPKTFKFVAGRAIDALPGGKR